MIDEKILDIYFSRGLLIGSGNSDGQVCIEAAIALASGESLNDSPACVSPIDREFWISLNDAPWSSPEARAEALRPAVIPQLDTAGTDRGPWVRALVLGIIREVLPLALHAAAKVVPDHAAPILAAAERCSAASDLAAASEAAKASVRATEAAEAIATYAMYALTYAADAADAANNAVWATQAVVAAATVAEAATYASTYAAEAATYATYVSTYAAEAATYMAEAATDAANAAKHAAEAATDAADDVLKTAVAVVLRAYIETE
jgi:hypothetical protein